MLNSLSLFVGLRYVRARSHKFFVSFITWVSLLCVCLGVMALIVVLSVMNGLEGRAARPAAVAVRARAHVRAAAGVATTPDWQRARRDRCAPCADVTGVAPSSRSRRSPCASRRCCRCACAASIPAHEGEVARVAEAIVEGKLADLTPGSDRVIVGRDIAQMLGLGLGDPITVLVPTTDVERRARTADCASSRVAGVFDAASQDYDGELLVAALDDVRALLPNPDARMSLHVNFDDALRAPDYSRAARANAAAGRRRSATGPWITPATSARSASRRPWWR